MPFEVQGRPTLQNSTLSSNGFCSRIHPKQTYTYSIARVKRAEPLAVAD